MHTRPLETLSRRDLGKRVRFHGEYADHEGILHSFVHDPDGKTRLRLTDISIGDPRYRSFERPSGTPVTVTSRQ